MKHDHDAQKPRAPALHAPMRSEDEAPKTPRNSAPEKPVTPHDFANDNPICRRCGLYEHQWRAAAASGKSPPPCEPTA